MLYLFIFFLMLLIIKNFYLKYSYKFYVLELLLIFSRMVF